MQHDLQTLLQPSFAAAILAAGTMGFAIQRGGTCMVAAVSEAVTERRFGRLLALAESGLWVSALLALATFAGLLESPEATYPIGLIAVAGGVLLGLGALINGACVFGSVARIGSRDWHFLLTPVGFYLGSLVHARLLLPASAAQPAAGGSLGAWLLLGLFLPLLTYRLYQLGQGSRRGEFAARLWHPHQATIMIGVTFVVLVISVGAWTYPESLYRAAHRSIAPYPSDLLLFCALLGGAVIGGWKKERGATFSLRQALACLGGGALMGVGSSMIPGGNDNLSLVGIPMGHGYAWIAIGAMALAIWTGLIVGRIWRNFAALPPNGIRPSG